MNIFAALGISVLLNSIAFLYAFTHASDKLTDFTYASTFAVIALVGVWQAGFVGGSLVVMAMVLIWAVRLGVYLFVRIHKIKRDKRFDQMRQNFWRFGGFWLLQAITVWVVMIPSLLYLQLPSEAHSQVSLLQVLGVGIWLIGFSIETIADWQKYQFKQDPANTGKWIASGLWKHGRHPNYFGEMLLWTGVWLFCAAPLPLGAGLISLIGPVWIIVLLRYVSGIPLLEQRWQKKWGSDPAFQEYRRSTRMLI